MEKNNIATKVVEFKLQVGNDNGNSEHDIIIDGTSVEQPNIISKVSRLPLLEELDIAFTAKNIHDRLITTVNSPSAAPGIYYCGNYALQSGERVRNIEVGAVNSKVDSDIIVINTLSQLAAYGVKKAFEQDKDFILNAETDKKIVLNVDMTTALPVTQYSKSNADKITEKFMKGKHQVTVHVGIVRVDVEIFFEFVKVLPEGVTATFAIHNMLLIDKPENELTSEEKNINATVIDFFNEFNKLYVYNEQNNKYGFKEPVDGAYFKKKKILHVSIGEGTVEYPLVDDIVFDPRFIQGSNNGMGHAIDKAIPIFMEEKGLRTYSRQNYSTVLRDPSHKYHNVAMDIVEPFIEGESEDILHNVKKEIERANNEIDILCVYGGGSIPMKDYLYQKLVALVNKADIKLFYVPDNYAVTLESKGMYEFTRSNLYKALKAKHLASKK